MKLDSMKISRRVTVRKKEQVAVQQKLKILLRETFNLQDTKLP